MADEALVKTHVESNATREVPRTTTIDKAMWDGVVQGVPYGDTVGIDPIGQ